MKSEAETKDSLTSCREGEQNDNNGLQGSIAGQLIKQTHVHAISPSYYYRSYYRFFPSSSLPNIFLTLKTKETAHRALQNVNIY